MFQSVKEQSGFVEDIADRPNKIENEGDNVDEDWDFDGTVSVNDAVATESCDKLKGFSVYRKTEAKLCRLLLSM